ncbi:MAG: transglycosylase SLT domain-containing protein [Myxococcaceae bacterium]
MLTTGSGILAFSSCFLVVGAGARDPLPVSMPDDGPLLSHFENSPLEALLPEPIAHPDRGRVYGDDELTAYFGAGKLAKAKAAFDGERWGEALLLLASEGEAPPVRFLRALCQLETGQTAAAAEHLTALAGVYPAMRDECLVRAGAANETLGRALSAADAYGLVSPDSPRFSEARLAQSRVLLEYGDLDGALAAVEALPVHPGLDRESRGEAFLAQAAVAAARSDVAAEREALVEVFVEGIEAQVRVATVRLAYLGGVPPEAAGRRALSLIERRRVSHALAVVKGLSKSGSPEILVCAERLARGLTLHQEADFDGAIEALTEAAKRCTGEPAHPRALLALAAAQAAGSPREARRTLDRLVSEHSASPLAARALIEAAELDLALDEPAKARARLGQVGNDFGESEVAADALFRSFWLSWKLDRSTADLAPLVLTAELPVTGAGALQRDRARYWTARVLQERGKTDGAASAFASLARDGRTSFYGQLALGKLAGLNPTAAEELSARPILPRGVARWPACSGPEGDEPRLRTARELARLGLPEAVPALLVLSRKGQSPERTRLLFELLRLSGDDGRAGAFARQAARDHQGQWAQGDAPLFAAAFPRPFAELVDKHALAAGVEPSLLQALIREESAFNPRARSWAGAMGLAQLMVPTAREVAQQVGVPWAGAAALYEPDLNLRLGSRYLANVMKRFGGNWAHAVASYNAGPGRVSGWLRGRPAVPLDEWVEDIPFDETRWYVKRVLSSEHVYRRLTRDPVARAATASEAGSAWAP